MTWWLKEWSPRRAPIPSRSKIGSSVSTSDVRCRGSKGQRPLPPSIAPIQEVGCLGILERFCASRANAYVHFNLSALRAPTCVFIFERFGAPRRIPCVPEHVSMCSVIRTMENYEKICESVEFGVWRIFSPNPVLQNLTEFTHFYCRASRRGRVDLAAQCRGGSRVHRFP